MSESYTPSVAEVVNWIPATHRDLARRMIAQVRREAAAEALRDAADESAVVPQLLAAVEAIRALHGEMRYHNPDGSVTPACSVCDSQPYPCETLQALDAALSGSEPDEGSGR